MVVEQLIFMVVSFAIFVYMFFRMIKNNDTSYVAILLIEAVGIALNFLEVLFRINLNIVFLILKYVFAIILPLVIIILEKRNIRLMEISNMHKIKFWMMMGNNKKAKQILINLLDKYPNNYKAHKMLAEIYEQEGGRRKAIDEYVQAIDLNKQDYGSYYKVANLLNILDKKDEAVEMLNSLLNRKPEMTEASQLLGDILISKEMYKEAVNVFQNALRYSPMDYELNYNLGMVHTMLNDFQNAKTCYEKAAEINSLLYNAKYSLAEIALIYKDLDEAEKRFLEVIEDEELSADAYYELSKISLIKGDKDTAIKYANVAIDISSRKIANKIKKEPLFIPVMAKIAIPFNLEDEKESKMALKEKLTKLHLEEMSELAKNLSYNDIKMLKKYNINQNGKEKESKKEDSIQDEKEQNQ